MATTKKADKTAGQAIDEMIGAVGGVVRIETVDGVNRPGKLTGVEMRSMTINGRSVDWPVGLQLNGDPGDVIPIANVRSIRYG